jgi:hypothetical protein
MALISNTGWVPKNKDIKVSLEGWTGTGTSVHGTAGAINCEDVEFFSVELPEKASNETEEFESNLRGFKDGAGSKIWEEFSGLALLNDDKFVNWKACVAEQECDSTGTITFATRGDNTPFAKFRAKIAKAGGGGGDATSFSTSFSPTFTVLEALSI